MHNESGSPFQLKTSNAAFAERNRNVFDQLSKFKCNLTSDEDMDVEGDPQRRQEKPLGRKITKPFRGKESIFKMPREPKTYMKTIPDFKKNPHKWKKYSLADVSDEHMSDKSNTKAALSFLNELKNRRNAETIDQDPSDGTDKILFRKHSNLKNEQQSSEKPSFTNSKMVMPEYVVGEKVKKQKQTKSGSGTSKKDQLKLDHLLYEDE